MVFTTVHGIKKKLLDFLKKKAYEKLEYILENQS